MVSQRLGLLQAHDRVVRRLRQLLVDRRGLAVLVELGLPAARYRRQEARAADEDESIDEVVLVDQAPIGRTPRGNPATYCKAFDAIRKLFASTAVATSRDWSASFFSFNVEGGRCPECKGAGCVQVEMQF